MLTVNNLIGFGAGGGSEPPLVTYRGRVHSTVAELTCTYTDAPVGVPAASRIVVVATYTSVTISSVTIGGVSATLVASYPTSFNVVTLWYAIVPTGETATVSATQSGAFTQAAISVWTIHNATSSTPVTSGGHVPGVSTTTSVALTGLIAGDAVVAAINLGSNIDVRVSWDAPMVEDFDVYRGSGASGYAEATSLTVSATKASAVASTLVTAAWR